MISRERDKVRFMYIVTSAEMLNLDEYTIHTIGIPAAVLMENAGRALRRRLPSYLPSWAIWKRTSHGFSLSAKATTAETVWSPHGIYGI